MTATKLIGRAVSKVSPGLEARLKSIWYTINGRRFEDAEARRVAEEERRVAVEEWRFADLKNYLRSEGRTRETGFAVEHSANRLRQLGGLRGAGIAVVSVVPPADTGIANFTVRAFASGATPVDVFFPHDSAAEYLAVANRLGGPDAVINFFSLEALDVGLASRDYAAVVWVLGNSDHHIETAKLLRLTRHLPASVPSYIEIHDPVLLNLTARIAIAERTDISGLIQQSSGVDLGGVDWDRARRGDHRELLERGATGIPALLNDVRFEGLILHSRAARDMVLRDWGGLDPARAHVLFHPVFEPFEDDARQHSGNAIRIGTFGVPAASKQTETVIEAFKLIRKSQPAATLLIAGFGAHAYSRACIPEEVPGLLIEDSPPTDRLLELMRGVDVAVQLRAVNTGESSGIIPQLLALNRVTIASSVGAFADYGDPVRYVRVGVNAEDLARAILEEAKDPARRAAHRKAYVEAHSPLRFMKSLTEIVGCEVRAVASPSGAREALALPGATDAGADVPFSALRDDRDPVPRTWPLFERLMQETGASADPYIENHLRRYRHTLAALESISPESGGVGLEVGTSWLFALTMRAGLGFERVDVTDFRPSEDRTSVPVDLSYPSFRGRFDAFNVNLESNRLPAEPEQYDVLLCCEVLEHMDVDPMFMLAELNRVARPGGRLLLTTPNVTSSRNVAKMLQGFAPHFYMQYHKDRSPYRHNIEYAPDQVLALVDGAGFRVDRCWTADTFEEPSRDALEILQRLGFPTSMRGDNLFIIATKTGPVQDRHPAAVYV